MTTLHPALQRAELYLKYRNHCVEKGKIPVSYEVFKRKALGKSK